MFVRIVEILNWREVLHTWENVHEREFLTWVTSWFHITFWLCIKGHQNKNKLVMVQKLSQYHVNTPWNFTVRACLHTCTCTNENQLRYLSCVYTIYTHVHYYISVIHVIPKHSTHSTKKCGFGYFRSTLDDTGHYGSWKTQWKL